MASELTAHREKARSIADKIIFRLVDNLKHERDLGTEGICWKDYSDDITAALEEAFAQGQREIKLPAEKDIVGSEHPEKYGHAYGWNDCLKELRRMYKIPDKEQLEANRQLTAPSRSSGEEKE